VTPPTNDILNDVILAFDKDAEVEKITSRLRTFARKARKRGVVVAISGGIDSSVTSALCVRAFGPGKVFGLLLPEYDSSSDSLKLGKIVAEHHGIEYQVQPIGPTLEAIGCYQWRDDAIRAAIPAYQSGWRHKLVISGGQQGLVNHFKIVIEKPDGTQIQETLGLKEYLQIVAATNYKQRVRKTVEYFHADRLNYAVVGTPNRLEYDQGFFVKNGDGAADVKPIAHLYKTQVYALARHLGLPEAVCNTIPTTDTYSLSQGQDEFYFALPYRQMDVAIWAMVNGKSAADLARYLGVAEPVAERIYQDIRAKRSTTAPLHWKPVTIEQVIDLPQPDLSS
jgi:NAD+ synthase